MSKLMHNVRAYTFWFLPLYNIKWIACNFLYIIFAVLIKFERSLNSYFLHNNNNYYYCLHHLGFCCLIYWQACMWDSEFSYIPNFMQMGEKAVTSDEQHLKWWPPASWIYYFSRFWSRDLFLVATNHIPANFY